MNVKRFLEKYTSDLTGKKIAVTGSTGGLGVCLCDYLAGLGASLILLDRNESRSSAHRDRLIAKYGVDVSCFSLDLEDISAVDEAAVYLVEQNVDVFIHNAGAYAIPRHKTSCGYDNVFQINFASPYYLIRRLLPHLRGRSGRVVVVGSIAHNYSHIDVSDIDFSRRSASSLVYGNSKRYLMYSLYELFREEKCVPLSVTHPGITLTNITAHYPKLIYAIIKHPMKVIFNKPKDAALSILLGVFESTEYKTWIGPRIFNIWGKPKKQKLNTSKTDEIAKIADIAESVYIGCCAKAEESRSLKG